MTTGVDDGVVTTGAGVVGVVSEESGVVTLSSEPPLASTCLARTWPLWGMFSSTSWNRPCAAEAVERATRNTLSSCVVYMLTSGKSNATVAPQSRYVFRLCRLSMRCLLIFVY